MRCGLRSCADSAGVSDPLPTAASRSHNPLVLGSNPSGPTSQPIEVPVVRKISTTDCQGSSGRLKLFSQLFEAEIILSQVPSEYRIGGSQSAKPAQSEFENRVILAQPVPLRVARRINDSWGCRRKGFRLAGLLLIRRVTVEKVGSSEKSGKSGDGKCLGDWRKSFVELPDAKRFLRIRGERVFQQPRDLSTVARNSVCPR
jgi:hypothetical protein